jgi:hypothetical protein
MEPHPKSTGRKRMMPSPSSPLFEIWEEPYHFEKIPSTALSKKRITVTTSVFRE